MSKYDVRPFEPADATFFPEFSRMGIIPERIPSPAWTGLADGEVIASAGIVPGNVGGHLVSIVFKRSPLDANDEAIPSIRAFAPKLNFVRPKRLTVIYVFNADIARSVLY